MFRKTAFFLIISIIALTGCTPEVPQPGLVDPPKIIAHRGANDRFNEHTLTAYKIAANDGVDALEIDLRMTKDDVLIAMHDETIDRTTNGEGEPEHYTIEEMKEYETVEVFNQKESEEEIPTLVEILDTFGTSEHYYIETRLVDGATEMEEPLINYLNMYDLVEKSLVTIQSFSQASLEKIQQLEDDIPLTLLYKKGNFELEEAIAVSYPIIGMESTDVTVTNVNQLHRAGKEVHVYFTNPSSQREEQKRVHELNVDGFFTDDILFTKELIAGNE
ncbi:glycerophosphodiester phosphodiesterase family protein [Oceanobacillus piezotolerans]|uniref:glycerophosphodiester phosphodiesterase family protein n=1 Tax=Oceanobacillus piezotolerans TaxID=2448030 RepID=UPI00131431C7|nr:glycerophosphodiester phosphodiesterase family protein [Oceanobacillus piezotolerans]